MNASYGSSLRHLLTEGSSGVKVANTLTLSRIVAIPIILGLLATGNTATALALYVAAILTDVADGQWARVTGTSSAYGARLDALVDNVFSLAILPFLLLNFPGIWDRQAVALTALFGVPVLYLVLCWLWKKRLLMYHFQSAKLGALLLFLAWPLMVLTGNEGWTILAAIVVTASRFEQIVFIARRGVDLDAAHGFVAVAPRELPVGDGSLAEGKATALNWYAASPAVRGPILTSPHSRRNAVGVHAGAYSPYRAIGLARSEVDVGHEPNFSNCQPVIDLAWRPSWSRPGAIVAMDPFGHDMESFGAVPGWQPSIAATKGQLDLRELRAAIAAGRLLPDGEVLTDDGLAACTKIAVEAVWYLPGLAKRLGVTEKALRRIIFEASGGAFADLIERPELKVFLPAIGGQSIYLFGDPSRLSDPKTKITCRMHDECNSSDVFGSTLCSCRPYLIFALEEAIRAAQSGGIGLIVYNRKEGRSLGEVTKFLVYNARMSDPRGDRAEDYFNHTREVAGVDDLRVPILAGDVLHWLGIDRIDCWISMSNLKADAMAAQGIAIGRIVALPQDRIPGAASVEISAKVAAGYFTATDASA